MRQQIENDVSAPAPGGYIGLIRTVLTTSGPTALIALALAWFLGVAVWGRLVAIETNQAKIMAEINTAKVKMAEFSAAHSQEESEHNKLLADLVGLTRQMCVNSAKNEAQTRACWAIGAVSAGIR